MSTLSQRVAQASVAPHATASSSPTNLKRRRFLLALGAGGAGAAAVVAQPLVAPLAEQAATGATAASQGYRETEHIRSYYATTRI